MSDREWLRGFLSLGARAEAEGIPLRDVRRQEDTVLHALDILRQRPGVMLADEVGMGKTFEALGVAAAFAEERRSCRIVILTPGPDLNLKWEKEVRRFQPMYDFGADRVLAVRSLADYVTTPRTTRIVIAPVTMFHSVRGDYEKSYLLSLFSHHARLHWHTTNAILRRVGRRLRRVNVASDLLYGSIPLGRLESRLRRAFYRKKKADPPLIGDLFEREGLAAFDHKPAVQRALGQARFELARGLTPQTDLLIIDEAHKLKNARSVRASGVTSVFRECFDKALFLTATPFQLDIGELQQVFRLFSLAKSGGGIAAEIDNLVAHIRTYQGAYVELQRAWSRLDAAQAIEFGRLFDRDPSLEHPVEDPALRVIADRVREVRGLKQQFIEPGFRLWMIRSLREDKRTYRSHKKRVVRPKGSGAIPFLIYERFVAELFRRGHRTHKASVETNMASSFSAARAGALLQENQRPLGGEPESYRQLLSDTLNALRNEQTPHPKVDHTVRDSLDAAERGEKTLIFCTRVKTLEETRDQARAGWELRLLALWRQVYPSISLEEVFGQRSGDGRRERGRHTKLQARFQRSQDALYLALREHHLRTIVPISRWATDHIDAVVELANTKLTTLRLGLSAAARLDYRASKRCIEQSAVELWSERALKPERRVSESALRRLRDPRFLAFGLDLLQDRHEGDEIGDHEPTWRISRETADAVLGVPGTLWELLAPELDLLNPELRVQVVEQLSRYLTYRRVTFVAELLAFAKAEGEVVAPVHSHDMLRCVHRFWSSRPGVAWVERLRQFLRYFGSRDEVQRRAILEGPIKTGDLVRHTGDGESRERLREAFNTPLYPMILVANEVMQEGLDLHRQCRRVIHHDLAWNPAQIEQRIGRVDRLGSLIARTRVEDPETMLDVIYPLVRSTIDERLYQVVKAREKWLEFLLGAPPNFQTYALGDDPPPPLPDELAQQLAIDLRPQYVLS